MQTYLILLLGILSAAAGQFLIKKGVLILGPQNLSFKVILLLIKSIFTNFYILAGFVFYALSFLCWLFVLSKMKLSVAYPSTSLMYIFVILGSYFIFKEPISIYQIIGIVLILGGLFFVFR